MRDTSVKQTGRQVFYGDPQKKIKEQPLAHKVSSIEN